MSTAPAITSAAQALDLLDGALAYLSAADAAQLPAVIQARCLTALERADARATAARASILAAFTAGQGHHEDGDYSPRSWLIHRTRITRAAAAGHAGWARRTRTHPRILAALAAGDLTQSWARTICGWTGRLPEDCRDNADAILAGAAAGGLGLRDLAELAAEMDAQSRPPDQDGPRFEDRAVRLETTFGGAGVLNADLTPECAAVLTAVLDALSAPRGADDDRTHGQRYHDALQDAMRRLVAAGLLPERAGQPVKVWAHVSLADLLKLDVDSALQKERTAGVRRQWAGHRAAASAGGSDGSAWLEGDAAEAVACDASVTPVVLGTVNPGGAGGSGPVLPGAGRARPGPLHPRPPPPGPHRPGPQPARPQPPGPRRPGPGRAAARSPAAAGRAEPRRTRAEHHRRGHRAAVRSGRARLVLAAPSARRPARRPQPAAGRRLQQRHPGRDPQRGQAPRPALPVGRRLRPARLGLRRAPHPAQEPRRHHQPG